MSKYAGKIKGTARRIVRQVINVIRPYRPESPFLGGWEYFEALNNDGEVRTKLRLPILTSGALKNVSSVRRRQLISLSRYLTDNFPLTAYAITQIENGSVPLLPKAQTNNHDWNERAEELFAEWAEQCDFANDFDFWQMQEAACRMIDIDGDIGFAWIVPGEDELPKIQSIDSARIESGYFAYEGDDFVIDDGVVCTKAGTIVGYLVSDGIEYHAIPVEAFLLLRESDRIGRYRGVPSLRLASNDIRDATDIRGFLKKGVKLAESIGAALETESGTVEEEDWGDPSTDDNAPNVPNITIADLIGGDIPILPSGHKLTQFKNERPRTEVMEFMSQLDASVALALGLPPAYLLDQRLTGPNQRAVIGKAQKRVEKRIRTMSKLVKWAWQRVIAYHIAVGNLEDIEYWDHCDIQRPAALTIDAQGQSSQTREDIKAGIKTEREAYGERGKDWQDEKDQGYLETEYELQKAKETADKFGLSVREVLEIRGKKFTTTTKTQEDESA